MFDYTRGSIITEFVDNINFIVVFHGSIGIAGYQE